MLWVLRNEHSRDHQSPQRENSCASWFVQLLQESHLIFLAKSIRINCCIAETDSFLSRKTIMQAFGKFQVSRMLGTEDLNCGNVLDNIFECTHNCKIHLTSLKFASFYIRLHVY